jgi:hypothetical protein
MSCVGPYNREGLLCGKCIDGYGPPVYSTNLKCVKCSSNVISSILKYMCIQFIPLTVFFMIVVISRLNITSGYCLFCQTYYGMTVGWYRYIFDYLHDYVSERIQFLIHISQVITELWTLLFFKSVIPPFCISEALNGIHIQLLTLVPAMYIVFLVITLCVLIELEARNYRPIRFIWKPFSHILKRFNTNGVSGSNAIIRAFATFIFLSSTTIVNTAALLAIKTDVYSSVIPHNFTKYLFIDTTVPWSFHEKSFVVTFAVVPCLFLVLIPAVLLCVYPTRIYRRLSQLISTRKQLAITAFAEALHNCFKDGLNGTRDYRALAGLIILVLPVCSSVKYITWKAFNAAGYSRHCITGYLSFALSLVVAYVRPCKSNLANLSLSYHAFMIGVLSFESSRWIDLTVGTEGLELTLVVIPLLSHILVISWAVYTSVKYIRSHYVSCFSFCPCNNFCSGCVRAVNRFVRGGYQRLPDAAPLMGI